MPLARLTQCHHASAHPGQVPSAFGRGRALPVHQSLTVHNMSSYWHARHFGARYVPVLIAYDMQDNPKYTYYYNLIPNKVRIDAKCTFRSKQLSRIATWTAPEVDIQS